MTESELELKNLEELEKFKNLLNIELAEKGFLLVTLYEFISLTWLLAPLSDLESQLSKTIVEVELALSQESEKNTALEQEKLQILTQFNEAKEQVIIAEQNAKHAEQGTFFVLIFLFLRNICDI